MQPLVLIARRLLARKLNVMLRGERAELEVVRHGVQRTEDRRRRTEVRGRRTEDRFSPGDPSSVFRPPFSVLCSQGSSLRLLALDRLEERAEVSLAETH